MSYLKKRRISKNDQKCNSSVIFRQFSGQAGGGGKLSFLSNLRGAGVLYCLRGNLAPNAKNILIQILSP